MTKLHGKRYAYKFNIDVIKREFPSPGESDMGI